MTFNRNRIPIIPELLGKRFREQEKLHLEECEDCQDKRNEIYANFTIKGKIYTDEARLCSSEINKVVKHFGFIGKKCLWYEMVNEKPL